jgi:hypothetical protein
MATRTDAVEGRLRRPSWRDPRLLVGLALIALSVAAVVWIVRGADTTKPYLAAARDLAPGTLLTDDDLIIVNVRVGSDEYVQGPDAAVGFVVDRAVGEGELVPASALVAADSYTSRAIALESSMPLARGVGVGSTVDVWVTVGDDAGQRSELVGEGLAVTEIREAESSLGSSGGQTVYVAVPLPQVGDVLDAVSGDGEVSIVAAGG